MQPATLVNNSYFFSANCNGRFQDYLDQKLKTFRNTGSSVDWWSSKANHQLHCTLGFVFGQTHATVQQMDTINDKLKARTITHLKDFSTIPLKIKGFDVTKNGWIILKFKTKKKLQDLHEGFIQETQNQGLKASKFSGKDFMPHISIGTLKNGQNPATALAELQKLFIQMSNDPLPFTLYDIHLNHVEGNKNQLLLDEKLKRREIGVISVDKSRGDPFVKLKTFDNAKKLAKELKEYYGIGSSKNAGMEKTIRKTKNAFALLLKQNEFNKVEGAYNNLT
jgi:2'-5' RNA ligase